MTMTATSSLSLKRKIAFQKKGLSIYCQKCKAWVGWAKVNQKSQPSFMEVDNDGQCAHYNPGIRRTHHPFPFPEEEAIFSAECSVGP